MIRQKGCQSSVMAIIDVQPGPAIVKDICAGYENYKLLFILGGTWKNSGKQWSIIFSNKPSSYKRASGFYIHSGKPTWEAMDIH